MPTLSVMLPPLHSGQLPVYRSPARYKVVACGRRFGKTRLGVRACIETALQGEIAWWVAPTYDLAQVGWRLLERLTKQIPGGDTQKGERICKMPGGGWVQVRTASDPDALRGEGLKRVVCDEAAYIVEPAWSQALRPALSDKHGDAWFLSSPAGRNYFYRLYLRGQDPEQPEYASWNMPTTANPYIDPAEVESARADMPDRWFRQEYLAEFLDDSGGVFRNVRAAVREGGFPRGSGGDASVRPAFVGVDLGRTNDATVLTAIQGGHVIDHDRFTGTGWDAQFGRLKTFCDRLKPAMVLIETNFNDMFTERAQRELDWPVDGFRTTEQSKRDIIDGLALGIERGEVTYPDIPVLVNELEAYEYTTGPTGKPRMAAPAGAHDDCVMSLALARWAETTTTAVGSWDDVPKARPGIFAGVRSRR